MYVDRWPEWMPVDPKTPKETERDSDHFKALSFVDEETDVEESLFYTDIVLSLLQHLYEYGRSS